MPTRIMNFLHDSVVTPDVPPILGTSFNVADIHVHDLQAMLVEFQRQNRNFYGIVEGIHVRVDNIAGGAAKITLRLCLDPDGDFSVVPDVSADLAPGVTTTDSGCAAVSVQLPLFQILGGPGNGNLYLFAKLDAGTADFTGSCITWRE